MKRRTLFKELWAKKQSKQQSILTKPIKHAFVLSNDVEVKHFGENITAMHAAAFLS